MHKKLQDGFNRSQEARGQGDGITWGGLSRWYRDIVSNWLEGSRKTQDGWFQKAPRWAEGGFKNVLRCLKMLLDGPEMAPRGQEGQATVSLGDTVTGVQNGLKAVPKSPKMAPRGFKIGFKMASRSFQGVRGCPQMEIRLQTA